MAWESKIVGYGEEAPEEIKGNPLNYRLHPLHQRNVLRDVLAEVGWVTEVIINQQTGLLLDGHLRVEEAVANGEASIPVTYVDLTENEERQILATLDPLASLVEIDNQKLHDLLEQINTNSENIEMFLDDLQPDISPSSQEVKDNIPPKTRDKEMVRVMFGPYKFEVSNEAYEEWLDRVRDTHGYDVLAITGAMKEFLLIIEAEEEVANDELAE